MEIHFITKAINKTLLGKVKPETFHKIRGNAKFLQKFISVGSFYLNLLCLETKPFH